MIRWFSRNRTSLCPTRQVALRATRHLNKAQRRNLFSQDPGTMKAAEGRWFEAMIYEMVLDLSLDDSSTIRGVASKGADARGRMQKITLGQDGLLYSRSGDIKIRGNGQDLAELDLLLMGEDGTVAFGEIVTSPANIREIEAEIDYKKRLLGYLFRQEDVPFVLFSSVDISRMATVRRLVKDPTNLFISTASCEEIRSHLHPQEFWQQNRAPLHHTKLLPLRSFEPVRKLEYKELHDGRRKEILTRMLNGTGDLRVCIRGDEWTPVKKILLGALFPNAVRLLASRLTLRIRERRFSPQEVERKFAKVVIALNIPDCEPILYMRPKGKREYLKMVLQKDGTFRCESSRTRKMLGFFLWLESVQPTLGTAVTRTILSSPIFPQKGDGPEKRSGKGR